jgi:flagellar motility protein MotE (MotC chaperone)
MRRFLEKLMVIFLMGLVVLASFVIIGFLDYTGFINLHSGFPEVMKKNAIVAEYVKFADINSLAPKDQRSVLLEEKRVYVDSLLKKMKLESTRILEEKKKLELLFRLLEEDRSELQEIQQDFEKEKAKEEELRQIKDDKALRDRLDNLAAAYSKMLPDKAGKVLDAMSPKLSFEVLRRLKPKVLGAILETLPEARAAEFVRVLQASQGATKKGSS